jgi:hypothetical protein
MVCNREADLEICRMSHSMPDAPAPETDAALRRGACGDPYFARRLERERDEARAELRRCHNEYICTAHDRAAEMEAIRGENQALRDALRVRIDKAYRFCPECDALLDISSDSHYATCRHHATEQAVMQ